MIYRYRGFNKKTGEKIKGKIEGNSIDEVKTKLSDYILVDIKPAKYNFNLNFSVSSKVSPKELAKMFNVLGLYLKSSIPLIVAISLTKNQTENGKLIRFLDYLENSIKEGKNLFSSIENQKIVQFPNYVSNTIKIGEESSKLDIVLLEISKFLRDEEKINSKTSQALRYPMFIVFVAIFMIAFMLTTVVPKIVKVFENMNHTLPKITQIVIESGNFLQHNWILILSIFFIITLLFNILYSKVFKFKLYLHKILLKTPIIKKMILSKELGRFSYLTSVLVGSGVNYITAVNLAIHTIENEYIKSIFNRALEEVREGKKLSISLQKVGFNFDKSFLQAIALGEETSQIQDVLTNISEIYFDENEVRIDTLLGLLEPTLIVIVGISIGFIVTAIMLPMFSMSMIQ